MVGYHTHLDCSFRFSPVLELHHHSTTVQLLNKRCLYSKWEGFSAAETFLCCHLQVSQQHAEIKRKENGEYFVTDLGSGKGTWCNDKQLKPHQEVKLHPEDKLYFGSKNVTAAFKVKLAHHTVETQLLKYIGEMEAAKKEEVDRSGSEKLAGAAF